MNYKDIMQGVRVTWCLRLHVPLEMSNLQVKSAVFCHTLKRVLIVFQKKYNTGSYYVSQDAEYVLLSYDIKSVRPA